MRKALEKAQTAIETIIILAVALAIFALILLSNSDRLTGISGQLQTVHANSLIDELANAATIVYQQGEGASTTIFITVPKNVEYFNFTGKTISVTLYSGGDLKTVYRSMPFNVTGEINAVEGIQSVKIFVKNSIANIGEDTLPPTVTATSPSGFISNANPTLSATTNEDATCKYDTSNTDYSSMGSTMTGSSTGHTSTVGPLSDGSYTYYVRCQDTSNNTMTTSATITFTVDTIKPALTFVSPTPANASIINRNWIFVNVSSNEVLLTATLEFDGVNETLSGSGTNWFANKTGLSAEKHTFKAYGYDQANNSNVTETRTVTTSVGDATPPQLLFSAADPTNDSNEWIYLQANVTDNVAVASVLAQLTLPNSSNVNVTLSLVSGNFYNATYDSTGVNGTYNISIIANDTSSNSNASLPTIINNTYYFESSTTILKGEIISGTAANLDVLDNVTFNVQAKEKNTSIQNAAVFASIPRPMARTSTHTTLFGAAIANPTDNDINLTTLTFKSQVQSFSTIVGLNPTTGWNVSNNNNITWSGTITIPARSGVNLTVNVNGNNNNTNGFVINVTAATTAGTISNAWQSAQGPSGEANPSKRGSGELYYFSNEYYKETTAEQVNIIDAYIEETVNQKLINAGAVLNISIPAGWSSVAAASQSGWNAPSIVQPTSTSVGFITVNTSTNLQGSFRLFRFNATAPSGLTVPSLYVFNSTLNGTENGGDWLVNPIGQLLVKVNPTATGLSLNHTSESVSLGSVKKLIIKNNFNSSIAVAFNLSVYNFTSNQFQSINSSTVLNQVDWRQYWPAGISSLFNSQNQSIVRIESSSNLSHVLGEDLLRFNLWSK